VVIAANRRASESLSKPKGGFGQTKSFDLGQLDNGQHVKTTIDESYLAHGSIAIHIFGVGRSW